MRRVFNREAVMPSMPFQVLGSGFRRLRAAAASAGMVSGLPSLVLKPWCPSATVLGDRSTLAHQEAIKRFKDHVGTLACYSLIEMSGDRLIEAFSLEQLPELFAQVDAHF